MHWADYTMVIHQTLTGSRRRGTCVCERVCVCCLVLPCRIKSMYNGWARFWRRMHKLVQIRLMQSTKCRNVLVRALIRVLKHCTNIPVRAVMDSPHSEQCAGTQIWAGHCRCYNSSLWTSLHPPRRPQTSSSSETAQTHTHHQTRKYEYD